MTSGPPYPRTMVAATDGFTSGLTADAEFIPFDIWATIISQYSNSPIITDLIVSMFDALDQTADIDDFFDKVFNILTAEGQGLDVWGRILGVSRVLQVPANDEYFGYEEALPDASGFGQAPFFSGQPVTDNFSLSDSAYRLLLLAKAAANISDGSIASINSILRTLFPGRGNCYCTDGRDMTMTYTFEFALTQPEFAIVSNSGVLPRPAGVSVTIIVP